MSDWSPNQYLRFKTERTQPAIDLVSRIDLIEKGTTMDIRTFGKTGLQVSTLGFGCGAVGGLLVRGEYKDMVRVIGQAIDAGITYFDTAPVTVTVNRKPI